MPALPLFFSQVLGLAAVYRYPLLFLGAAVEGPILTVVAGFLLHQSFLGLFPTYMTLVAGDLAGDVAWYYIGYFFARPVIQRHGKFLGLTPELFAKIKSIFTRKTSAILFISKITMGFGMALGTLMTAGAAGIRLRVFLFYNALGEFVYVGGLMVLGYFLGYLYDRIALGFKVVSLLGIFFAVGLAVYGFSRYVKNKSLES